MKILNSSMQRKKGFLLFILLISSLISCNVEESGSRKVKTHKWISIGYGEMIDKDQIIRTGQSLGEILANPSSYRHLKGAIQPYMDHYTYLLQHVIEMRNGTDQNHHNDVVDLFHISEKQPAWVALFRGRFFITSDFIKHARVFLPGEDAETAYRDNYCLIRHCLSGLLPNDGSKLTVEVYSYKNDYFTQELSLNLNPYTFESADFLKPSNKIALDLAGLESFFKDGGGLEGAKIDKQEGLILFAKSGPIQTLMGQKISLSDFAVAYRAIFHSGDNEAFISLDPNKDATKVTVNFGGFLEDTRIGSVVLEADKRFKTITTGLDPNSFKDIRRQTRKLIPTFISGSERDLSHDFTPTKKWIGTRFWFYPDSVEVESDFNYHYALIKKPQFTADAERSKDDYANIEEFNKRKQIELNPSIRENIDHLNQNYLLYAGTFPEIKDLMTVARLMGICVWLQKADTSIIDLDALLSVELPAYNTERTRTKLLSVLSIASPIDKTIDVNYIKEQSSITYLSPILDQDFNKYFSNITNLSKYLCLKNNLPQDNYKIYYDEASKIMVMYNRKKVRDFIKTKDDLKNLVEYASKKVDLNSSEQQKLKLAIDKRKNELDKIKSQIERARELMKSDYENYNSYVEIHNELVPKYENLRNELNRHVLLYNQLHIQDRYIMEIGGGINLNAKNFVIKAKTASPILNMFEQITIDSAITWKYLGPERWLRSRTVVGGSSINTIIPKRNLIIENESRRNDISFLKVSAKPNQTFWKRIDNKSRSWRDQSKIGDSYSERYFDSDKKEIHIAEYHSDKLDQYVIGRFVGEDRIIFVHSSRKDLLKPKEPPIWWNN